MAAPRLLEQVRGEIRARHYSRRTEDAYVHWIRRFIVFHGKGHPSPMGAPEVSTFLTWLAVERHVSVSTQNQALSAVLFLYRDVLGIDVGTVGQVPRARTPVQRARTGGADRLTCRAAKGRAHPWFTRPTNSTVWRRDAW